MKVITIDIKMIIKKQHKQLNANKLDNLIGMDILLERHKLPKLTQEKVDILNSFISIINTEYADKDNAPRKFQTLMVLLVDSTKIFRRK